MSSSSAMPSAGEETPQDGVLALVWSNTNWRNLRNIALFAGSIYLFHNMEITLESIKPPS